MTRNNHGSTGEHTIPILSRPPNFQVIGRSLNSFLIPMGCTLRGTGCSRRTLKPVPCEYPTSVERRVARLAPRSAEWPLLLFLPEGGRTGCGTNPAWSASAYVRVGGNREWPSLLVSGHGTGDAGQTREICFRRGRFRRLSTRYVHVGATGCNRSPARRAADRRNALIRYT